MFKLRNALILCTVFSLLCSMPASAGPWTVKTEEPEKQKPQYFKIRHAGFGRGLTIKNAAPAYQPRHSTVAHKLLKQESTVLNVTDEMYKLLDDVIDKASARVQAAHSPVSIATPEDCKIIDDVLIENNFVYPGTGLTQYFSDALANTKLDGLDIVSVLNQPHNYRRRAHIEQHMSEPFHIADCDTASFVYLAVFENLKMDRALVEIPRHNFIRCYDKEKALFNWETMDGITATDQHYITGWYIPQPAIEKGIYLSRMSDDNVLGYGHCLVAQGWEQRREYRKAIDEYTLGTQMYDRMPGAWNNTAWVYVTARDPQIRNGKKAIEFALRAVDLVREANWLDTLACAYAEDRQFEKAIQIEQEAYYMSPNPEYRANLDAFRAGKTWIESHPEMMVVELHGNR